ncbi:ATP-binding protein [Mastigocladopsis repens]|uniref:TniB family NTP-binding protein n=1 Tax=Mastigocladopsis repens TaxID=221287 RepID=UPI0002F9DF38|nr:ATP-binding protein [Mastigocladopsis repens]
MARSLRVAQEYIQKVKSSLQRSGYPSQKAFATEMGRSESTIKNFLRGEPVDYLNFVEFCEKLGLDWQEIADKNEPDTVETRHGASLHGSNITLEETSPFITGSPITHPRYFFGRQKELKRLFDLLKRHPLQNAAIIGKRRIGKTSLLHYLKNITTTPPEKLRSGQKYDWLPQAESYKWIFVDFQDPRMASRERLLGYILECLNLKVPTPCNLDYFMDVVSENLHNPTVILLDEIGVGLQRCPELDDEFWECLRSLATNHTRGNLAFILATHESPIELARNTGHSSPFFNIFGYTATLGALTEAEARELIASSPIPFPDEDVEWILQQSQRLPLLLQILCRERLFNLEDEETDENWREEGLRQIVPFRFLLEEP